MLRACQTDMPVAFFVALLFVKWLLSAISACSILPKAYTYETCGEPASA